jgi:hypothetical protein
LKSTGRQERAVRSSRKTDSSNNSGYYHYFTFGLESYVDNLLVRVREEAFQIFVKSFAPSPALTILDIGVSADDHVSSNYFEKRYHHTERITGLSVGHFPELRAQVAGLQLVEGDGRALPFADGTFDIVYSHAVIEHVGSRGQQSGFLAEALRVARLGVFVTTPNRWHPVETHTGLPFLHFLPAAAHRRLCRLLGKGMYASEQTLHLMGAPTLLRLLGEARAGADGAAVRLHRIRWFGFASNLVLVVRKSPPAPAPAATGRARLT